MAKEYWKYSVKKNQPNMESLLFKKMYLFYFDTV